MVRFAVLGDQLAASFDVADAILDGEIIAANGTGRPRFYALLRGTLEPAYVAFDLLWLNGTDLRPLPLLERRRRLQGVVPKRSAVVSEALSVAGRGHELFKLTRAHDLEGIVAKRLGDPYGSWVRWLKIKNPNYSQNAGRRELFDRSDRRKRTPPPPGLIRTSSTRLRRPGRAFRAGQQAQIDLTSRPLQDRRRERMAEILSSSASPPARRSAPG